ncbi:MAG: NAD(P)/FAD-dependent oxidoreductase [Chloroflexi bacterium]|nr:NAD(P)/FAD-dependent oxidoreductase [Chloroflexota bacterium]
MQTYDIAVIGAGVVGTAIARELSRYQLEVVLLEAKPDVGMGTSKANTAIWHTGFDAKPGTLEARLLRRSYALLEDYVDRAGIPTERLGGLLVAWTEEQYHTLPSLLERAHANGVTDVRIISAEEVYRLEPRLNSGAWGGLLVPGESLICPFTLPISYATEALLNGVTLKLNFPVQNVQEENGLHIITGPDGQTVAARYLVNAAGLYSDEIDHMLGHYDFTVTPRRGELIVYDKFARRLINHVILPVPTAITKGVLISPTVYGNVLLGPTAEDLDDKTNTATSEQGLQSLLEKGRAILPELLDEEVTATYAGLRAATEHKDYQIRLHAEQRYVCVGGIRSTGVSASLGIAEYVAELLEEAGVPLRPKAEFKTFKMPNIGEARPRPYQRDDLIAQNPDYGRMVCHCEKVSLGEILDAIHSPLPARTLDALRRRTRAMQGRCQGFNCQAHVVDILARETGQDPKFLLALDGENPPVPRTVTYSADAEKKEGQA